MKYYIGKLIQVSFAFIVLYIGLQKLLGPRYAMGQSAYALFTHRRTISLLRVPLGAVELLAGVLVLSGVDMGSVSGIALGAWLCFAVEFLVLMVFGAVFRVLQVWRLAVLALTILVMYASAWIERATDNVPIGNVPRRMEGFHPRTKEERKARRLLQHAVKDD